MDSTTDASLVEAARVAARPLTATTADYDVVLDLIGDARLVLLGEATHGTHEFYRERAEITKRLIEEQAAAAVAVEADWPDADRVNRYVCGVSGDRHARQALGEFRRFPTWMWRNADVVEFVEWLRAHNERLAPGAPRVGFYGRDLYNLRASMEAVLRYLEKVDPRGAARVRALRLLRPLRRQRPRLWVSGGGRADPLLSGRGPQRTGRAATAGGGGGPSRRSHHGGRALRRGAERAPGEECGGLLPHDVRLGGLDASAT